MNNTIVIDCVELTCVPSVHDFVTPDWSRLLDFYPYYFRAVCSRKEVPKTIQEYVLAIAKALEVLRSHDGRVADVWLHRLAVHFGGKWLAQYFNMYDAYTKQIHRMKVQS